jgi:hypothetical protein
VDECSLSIELRPAAMTRTRAEEMEAEANFDPLGVNSFATRRGGIASRCAGVCSGPSKEIAAAGLRLGPPYTGSGISELF